MRFILGYDIHIQYYHPKIEKEYAACVFLKNTKEDCILVISQPSFIARSILWHEAGHVETFDTKTPIECEVNAHMWAVTEAKKRGYSKIVKELYLDLDQWDNPSLNLKYKKARKIILKKLEKMEER